MRRRAAETKSWEGEYGFSVWIGITEPAVGRDGRRNRSVPGGEIFREPFPAFPPQPISTNPKIYFIIY